MVTSLDRRFEMDMSLKWLPFIGAKFLGLSPNQRVLIIGESHYHDNSEESISRHDSKYFTREVIKELAIERWYWGTKVFPNFHRAIFGRDDFDTSAFWNSTAFYNFIQRAMVTNKARPTFEDYYNAWFSFFKIIDILKPKVCVFIGVEASNSLAYAIQKTTYNLIYLQKDERVGRTYSRIAAISDNKKDMTEIVFIQHTSKYFSWFKWHEYLKKRIPNALSFFEEKVND